MRQLIKSILGLVLAGAVFAGCQLVDQDVPDAKNSSSWDSEPQPWSSKEALGATPLTVPSRQVTVDRSTFVNTHEMVSSGAPHNSLQAWMKWIDWNWGQDSTNVFVPTGTFDTVIINYGDVNNLYVGGSNFYDIVYSISTNVYDRNITNVYSYINSVSNYFNIELGDVRFDLGTLQSDFTNHVGDYNNFYSWTTNQIAISIALAIDANIAITNIQNDLIIVWQDITNNWEDHATIWQAITNIQIDVSSNWTDHATLQANISSNWEDHAAIWQDLTNNWAQHTGMTQDLAAITYYLNDTLPGVLDDGYLRLDGVNSPITGDVTVESDNTISWLGGQTVLSKNIVESHIGKFDYLDVNGDIFVPPNTLYFGTSNAPLGKINMSTIYTTTNGTAHYAFTNKAIAYLQSSNVVCTSNLTVQGDTLNVEHDLRVQGEIKGAFNRINIRGTLMMNTNDLTYVDSIGGDGLLSFMADSYGLIPASMTIGPAIGAGGYANVSIRGGEVSISTTNTSGPSIQYPRMTISNEFVNFHGSDVRVVNPIASNNVANKQYVDGAISNWWQSPAGGAISLGGNDVSGAGVYYGDGGIFTYGMAIGNSDLALTGGGSYPGATAFRLTAHPTNSLTVGLRNDITDEIGPYIYFTKLDDVPNRTIQLVAGSSDLPSWALGGVQFYTKGYITAFPDAEMDPYGNWNFYNHDVMNIRTAGMNYATVATTATSGTQVVNYDVMTAYAVRKSTGKSVTNSWIDLNSVTNRQIFINGQLTSWTTNGVEL